MPGQVYVLFRAEIRRLLQQMHTVSQLESEPLNSPVTCSAGEQQGGARGSGMSVTRCLGEEHKLIKRPLASSPKYPTEVIGC